MKQQQLFLELLTQLQEDTTRLEFNPRLLVAEKAAAYLRLHFKETLSYKQLSDHMHFHSNYIALCMKSHIRLYPAGIFNASSGRASEAAAYSYRGACWYDCYGGRIRFVSLFRPLLRPDRWLQPEGLSTEIPGVSRGASERPFRTCVDHHRTKCSRHISSSNPVYGREAIHN